MVTIPVAPRHSLRRPSSTPFAIRDRGEPSTTRAALLDRDRPHSKRASTFDGSQNLTTGPREPRRSNPDHRRFAMPSCRAVSTTRTAAQSKPNPLFSDLCDLCGCSVTHMLDSRPGRYRSCVKFSFVHELQFSAGRGPRASLGVARARARVKSRRSLDFSG